MLCRYSLPHIALEHKYTLRCRPQTMAINCDSRMSIIDNNGVLTFFDLAFDGAGEGWSGGGARHRRAGALRAQGRVGHALVRG